MKRYEYITRLIFYAIRVYYKSVLQKFRSNTITYYVNVYVEQQKL